MKKISFLGLILFVLCLNDLQAQDLKADAAVRIITLTLIQMITRLTEITVFLFLQLFFSLTMRYF